ncbi:hypothetical protein RV04_GL001477 [Enterococcus hermanniensis]|uniref:Alpha/beta hydrolase fold-3 domain-containing protein n=1 Tax=Enterococcus hermanniensis TaxID=249189 RepID=A0A1L8TPR0_9ENTE|nr:hypothetical protein RV04_GL001477 [Enterococcus hermanniensis]
MVYGSKNDLPSELKQIFLAKGYTILALDYLLAPNSTVEEIIAHLKESVQQIYLEIVGTNPLGICGRSAGSFLMLHLTNWLIKTTRRPAFLINFYGYSDLMFNAEKRKLIDQAIQFDQIKNIDQTSPVWDDPLFQRFPLYHYAVQQQKLICFYGLKQATELAISPHDLQTFPRTFSTASTTDEEVPFIYSKKISEQIPEGYFQPVYYLPHDFLKLTHRPEVIDLLQELKKWLA